MAKKESIIESLDAFIRKYYKNLLIKGGLYAIGVLISLFIVVVILEHFSYFGSVVRGVIFWVYVALMAFILVRFVISPLLKMCKLGKRISYDEAAKIIGKHFPEVSDKLLNLLQLQNQVSDSDSDLLKASIEQKTVQLSPIPFVNAIDLKANKKYLKFAIPPVLIVIVMLLISPSMVTKPTQRIINYNTYYERPAPFKFVIENSKLEVSQQDDFELRVAVVGNALPAEVYIHVEENVYRMKQVDKEHYTYLFKNQYQSRKFFVEGGGVQSEEYELRVFPKPAIVNFRVLLSYPSYTARTSETLESEGDLTIPEGTIVKWIFQTKDVDTFYFNDTPIKPNENGRIEHSMKVLASTNYHFYAKNRYVNKIDTLQYAIDVVPDAVPMIMVAEMIDSTMPDKLFFHGRIKDDYGFNKLEFKIIKSNVSDDAKSDTVVTEIGITKETSQEFYYSINTMELALKPGDKLQYYFEIWDNDAINGSKSSKSQQFALNIPTEKELDNILEKNASEAKESAEVSMSELKKMQEDINELMRKLVDKKELTWQDKKELQELAKKQNEVKNMLEQMKEQLKENSLMEQKYREQNEKIIEKQKELDKLFNEVMTDEMKEMMKEIDKMLEETNKKKVQEQLENLKMSNEELEKQLDQNLELMKRLEMEKRVDAAVQKADKLAEKQRELAEKTDNAKGNEKENLMKEQEKLSNDFQELKKDIDKIQKDYKEIDKNINFEVSDSLQNSIDQHQQNSKEQLNKGKNNKSAQEQNQAAENLEQLSEQMAEQQTDIEQSDLAEDAEMVRQLLKNLVQLSFDQEDLIQQVNAIYIQDPKYQKIITDQNKIKNDFRNVEDSLRSMAKRQVNVASAVTRELSSVNSNVSKSLDLLLTYNQSFYGNSKNPMSARSMQYTMTSFNNLALILAESLDQMQNQMRQNQQKKNQGSCKNKGMKKQGSCSNPGSSKPSAKSMKQMQDELNKQMEALKKQLDKQGKNKQSGRKKIGEQGSMSEQFAKMAAQQEMIRRMMQEYGQEMKQQEAGNGKLAREINEMMRQMEQTETDLVNKTITQQTIRRQQQIMTRLLQHEKAEMEREKDNRRESKEAKDIYQPSQKDLEQFKKLKEKNIEMFQTMPPSLSPYYKSKVDEYFYKF